MRTDLCVSFQFVRRLEIYLCYNENLNRVIACTEKDFEVDSFNEESKISDYKPFYVINMGGFEKELNEMFHGTVTVGKPWVESFYNSKEFRASEFKLLLIFAKDAFDNELLTWNIIKDKTKDHDFYNLVDPKDFDLLIKITQFETTHEGEEVFTDKQIVYDTKEGKVIFDSFGGV